MKTDAPPGARSDGTRSYVPLTRGALSPVAPDTTMASGARASAASVADGTLPHEAPAGGWQVNGEEEWELQPAVTVTTTQQA